MSSRKKIVLLVDDDQDDRHLFKEAAEPLRPGTAAVFAKDGQEALDMLTHPDASLPDVIFLDINMPVMNGWNCLKSLKSDPKLKEIPVIMYSTSSHKRDVDIALDLGALCFCVKPEKFSGLKEVIRVVSENLDGNLKQSLSANKTKLNFKGLDY